MDKKRTYRIKNWSEYNKSLIQRGDITLWCSDDAIESWILPNQGKRGRPLMYADEAILSCFDDQGRLSPAFEGTGGISHFVVETA